jgi:tetratricopeptide (TPR) repeat protein
MKLSIRNKSLCLSILICVFMATAIAISQVHASQTIPGVQRLKEGIAAYEHGEYDEAIFKLEMAVYQIPEEDKDQLWNAHLYLGLSYLLMGDADESTEQFIKAHGLIKNKSPDSNIHSPKILQLFKDVKEGTVSSFVYLRSDYKDLSVSDVVSMPNISIRKKVDWGFYGHSTIKHKYEPKTIGGDKVVVDHATGLMWHQSGSEKWMNWKNARKWIKKLNESVYADYRDWRLPTIEEAASLLESSERNGNLYLDPVFSNEQKWIWSGDKMTNLEFAWRVRFLYGDVGWIDIDYYRYVRPVRSVDR